MSEAISEIHRSGHNPHAATLLRTIAGFDLNQGIAEFPAFFVAPLYAMLRRTANRLQTKAKR
jgi:hypothetical protein